MSSDISMTSTLMTRLLGLKGASASPSGESKATDKPSTVQPQTASVSLPAASTETTNIAVTSLNQKAQDLQKLLDGLDRSITTLQTARDAINDIIGHIEEAGGYTVRARDTLKTSAGYEGNKDRLAELESRFSAALAKIDASIEKAGKGGINLLKGDILTTSFGGKGSGDLLTEGTNLSSAGLDFRKPDFSSQFKVQDSRIDVMNAIDIAVTMRHQITSDIMLIQTRQDFSAGAIESLTSGASTIQFNGLGEEAANLLALHVRQLLSETEEPLASEAQQYLLKQF